MAADSGLVRMVPIDVVPGHVCAVLLTTAAGVATKIHVISFAKWMDTSSNTHWVLRTKGTERLLAVRRAFCVNDSLSEDSGPR